MRPEELALFRDAIEMMEKPKDNLARKALEHIDSQAAYIARLEAAYLKTESQRLWDLGKSTGQSSFDCPEARESLGRIKAGEQG